MKFFVPHATSDETAEATWAATKKFAEETLGWNVSDRRIFSIRYRHDGQEYHSQVGREDPTEGEVLIILESNAYLVCTPNRGVLRGMPILVGKNEAIVVTDFE